jgi:hypothetical protein
MEDTQVEAIFYSCLDHPIFEEVHQEFSNTLHTMCWRSQAKHYFSVQYCDEEIVRRFGMPDNIREADPKLLAAGIKCDVVTLKKEDGETWYLHFDADQVNVLSTLYL